MKKLKIILIGYISALLWAFFSTRLLESLNEESMVVSDFMPLPYTFFFSCIFAPLWEELAFRYGPIEIARKTHPKYIVPVVVISSCIFGWLHSGSPETVLIQGGLGFIFSYVYIKNNYSYFSSVLVHFLYNLTILILTFYK